MEYTEAFEITDPEPFDMIDGEWFDPEEGTVMTDPFGLPFEPMDRFSDAPLEFEELAETLWKILNDTHVLSVRYNRHSPCYLQLCSLLEKDIKQLASLCVTKAVLEQKGLSFPKPEGPAVTDLYAMVSLHFRKSRQAFQDTLDAGKGYDIQMAGQICRWGILAERLKATEERIQKIRSGKVNADQILDRAQVFKGEPRGKRPQRDPQMIRKAVSLPVITSLASEMIRKKREAERQRIREERARVKAGKKPGPGGGIGAARPFPAVPITPESIRKLLLEEAEACGDTDAMRAIQTEDPEALKIRLHELAEKSRSDHSAAVRKNPSAPPSSSGPSDVLRKKLRGQRKKKRK